MAYVLSYSFLKAVQGVQIYISIDVSSDPSLSGAGTRFASGVCNVLTMGRGSNVCKSINAAKWAERVYETWNFFGDGDEEEP